MKQPFENHPKLAELLQHAATNWKTDDTWSATLAEINSVCSKLESYASQFNQPPVSGGEVEEVAGIEYYEYLTVNKEWRPIYWQDCYTIEQWNEKYPNSKSRLSKNKLPAIVGVALRHFKSQGVICNLSGRVEDYISGAQWQLGQSKQGDIDNWISTSERTPDLIEGEDYSENVLAIINGQLGVACYCYIPGDEGGYVWANCYNDLEGDAEFDDDYEVTHWRTLPTPPSK